MVTSTRQASHRIFEDHPEALNPVFEALRLPPLTKTVIEVLDSALKVQPSEGEDFLLAIEVQAEQDPDKAPGWARRVAQLHMTYHLPVLLLVICRNRPTATWAAGPFEHRIGTWTSQILRPLVLGPDDLPEITDEPTVIRQPALATLATIVHSDSEKITNMLGVLVGGIRSLNRETATYLCELLEVGLEGTPGEEIWRGDVDQIYVD
ncbi:hypothetical protein [Streptomyces sp. NL15-2K]|uniref:hypothetical protein n=1 Tax=Streptomyces sp. NL15-2K TaxID=376149 RepID=UPI000F58C01E|nr:MULTISPECIES: hypothetical protein [Actinomycetes]WKX10859.1 hypothetical protein Q4V64_26490 [Kutzneria buriramensis]GCB47583.1 hypothetical protein SNL152K_4888 [Streptomyces sp. NL15-2K]